MRGMSPDLVTVLLLVVIAIAAVALIPYGWIIALICLVLAILSLR
jgi:hypothetical protein